MAVCIRCGSELAPNQPRCRLCGSSGAKSRERAPAVPRGTWHSEEQAPAGSGAGPHSAPQPSSGRSQPPDRDPDRSPVREPGPRADPSWDGGSSPPGAAVAVAREAPPERTGPHRVLASPQEQANVVPLQHPEPAEAEPESPGPGAREAPAQQDAASARPSDPGAAAPSAPPRKGPRPPVLASEVLREDIEPTEPGRAGLRIAGVSLGGVGAPLVVATGGPGPQVLAVAVCLALIAVLSAVPLRYRTRALGTLGAVLAGLAAATTAWWDAAGVPGDALLLAPAVLVLAGGLIFRSRYRASGLARITVLCGILTMAVWLVWAGGLSGLEHLSAQWSSWGQPLGRLGFLLLVLLSLLTFMSSVSTGGTQVWAIVLILWYAAHAVLRSGLHLAATGAGFPHPYAGIELGGALLVAVGSMAVAQTLAVLAGATQPSHPLTQNHSG